VNDGSAGIPAVAGLLGCLLLVGCSPASEEEPRALAEEEPQRPNVVLIVLDTTRADILSAYGYSKPTSPVLADLAAEGTLFQNAMSTDFWTLPAHASLFTGEYPSQHRATSETNQLDRGVDTLAEKLRRAGYKTGAFVSNAWIGRKRGFAQGFQSYTETWKSEVDSRGDHALDRLGVEGAIEWIQKKSHSSAPFFLFLNLNGAHMPYSPDPLALVGLSPGPRSLDRSRRLRKLKGMWSYLGGRYSLDAEDFEILRELYEAEVLMLDGLVGSIVASLEEHDLLDSTLLIVTSDHGENLGEHGRVDHLLSLYETTIRIPLIIRYPGHFEAGSVRDDLVSLIDISPTVLALSGLGETYPEVVERSLLAPSAKRSARVFAENDRPVNGIEIMKNNFPDFDSTTIDQRMRMLRTPTHKLIWHEDGRTELYDLAADPHELTDLSESNPELRNELLTQLETWMETQGSVADAIPMEIDDPQTRKRLEALGYVE
jgi:arylsulfatase A-like enzyme